MLARAHQTLEPYFIEHVLPEDGHGLLATQESWEELLDTLPEQAKESVGSLLKQKWAKAPYKTSPAEKWELIKRHLKVKFDLPAGVMGVGGSDEQDNDDDDTTSKKRQKRAGVVTLNAERQRVALWPAETIFKFTYPRLDINVSKMQNHLLKSPFCVHPKTGRVCVPIDPNHSDDFDPFAVPTLPKLMQELDDYHNKYEKDDDGKDNDNMPKYDWEKTSLKPYFEHFQKDVLEPMQKELRRRSRDQAEAEAALRGDF
jgi:DNA primase small subunit